MKNMILLSATLAAAVLGTESARGADGAVEVHWNAGDGDMSDLGNWITHSGDWNFDDPVTEINGNSDLRFYGAGERSVTMSGNMTAHTLKIAPKDADYKVTIDATGKTLTFDVDGTGNEWNKGIIAAGQEVDGVWKTGWLVLSGGTFCVNTFLRAASEGRSDEGHARVTVTGNSTRVEGVKGDVSCGDNATDCTLEILDGAYVLAGRGLRNGETASAENNEIRISGEGSLLEMRPTGDAAFLPTAGHGNRVIIENGGVLRNSKNEGDWYGTTYVGMAATAVGNSMSVLTGGKLDLSEGGELRIGFNQASENSLVVDGVGSSAVVFGQLALGSGASKKNTIDVKNGGLINLNGPAALWIGWDAGSDENAVTVTGAGSKVQVDQANIYLGVNGGCSNTLVVSNGGKVSSRHLFIGSGAASCYNKAKATGEGTVIEATIYDFNIGNGGHHNELVVENGATIKTLRDIFIGGGEGVEGAAALEACSNNTLRIYNATLSQPEPFNYDIKINGRCKLSVGGSHLVTDTPWLHASEGSELEFVFDEEGIAPFETRFETFFAKEDGTPTPAKITIDARNFVKMQGNGTFILMQAKQGHSTRRPDGSELTAEQYEALNAAMKARTVCYPSYLRPEFDMAHSKIMVTVPRMGMRIMIR